MNLLRKIAGFTSGEKVEDEHQAPQPKDASSVRAFRTYTFGTDSEGKEYGVFKQDRVHTAVLGFPGTGKSTFLLSLIVQHIQDGEGFTLFDPHGDLAKKVLNYIPRDQWDKVVYIDPMTAFQYGLVVKINFLEHGGELDRSLVARSFMDSLAKIYTRFWGPRLDMILLNALYVLLDQREAKLTDLYYVIADEGARNNYLQRVRDPKVVTFWRNEYKRMPKDASSAALTKIYRIIQEKIITPIFDCYKSSIDFRRLLDKSNYVIVNLGEGRLTSDLSNFLGSLILSRIYIAGMSREDTAEEHRVPHYLYIDEAHRFTSTSTKDILEALRKYKVYATIASQYLDQYPKEIAKSIPSLCDTIVCFGVGKETAQTLEEFFQPYYTYEQIVSLPNYWFAVSAKVKGVREFAALKTVNLKHQTSIEEDVIKHSLSKYGKEPELLQAGTEDSSSLPYPQWFEPISWYLLTLLFYEPREWSQEDLFDRLSKDRGVKNQDADSPFRMLLSEGFVSYRESLERWLEKVFEDGKEVERERQKRRKHYQITQKGMQLFRDIPVGQRGGADAHLIMIRKQADMYRRMGFFCFIDTGVEPGRKLPDILVYPYREIETEGGRSIDARLWDTPHRFAIEVETEPEKHPERVYENWEKNRKLGLPTIVVVDCEERQVFIKELLTGRGVKIVPNILTRYFVGNAQVDIQPIKLDGSGTVIHLTAAQATELRSPEISSSPIGKEESEGATPIKSQPSVTGSPASEPSEMLMRYLQEGWGLKVKKAGGRRYLYARKSEGGRRIERSVGVIEGELKEALSKVKPELLGEHEDLKL
ncbi:MAG: type IV secretion system DNA-binding domain-containing protein [Thaumarchaeota archaeon]|nr:type IV secretion system DNA-binding domain-containing protein [Nitrososphaerota archaeon]